MDCSKPVAEEIHVVGARRGRRCACFGSLAVGLIVVLAGCRSEPAVDFVLPAVEIDDAAGQGDLDLSTGDLLEVTYFKVYESKGPYRVGINDTLRLVVKNRPELDSEAVVLPDGTCVFPWLGAVPVKGRTIAEVTADVTEHYRGHLDSPEVDVLLPKPRGRVEDFFEVLGISPGGAVRQVRVSEEGTLHLPLIGPVSVLDRPLSAVRSEVEAAYAAVLPEIDVTIALTVRSPHFITVMGEVRHNGVFEVPGRVTVMRALAYGGGVTDRAYLPQVLHVRPRDDGSLEVNVLDIEGLVAGEASGIWLARVCPDDLLYVPRSPISDINVFVDQYLRKMIPISVGIGIPVGGD